MTAVLHAREKLASAVHGLSAGQGPIKERLEAALLACSSLRPEDFPVGELRHKWSEIEATLSPGSDIGSKAHLTTLLAGLDREEASKLAGKLVELALRLHEYHRG